MKLWILALFVLGYSLKLVVAAEPYDGEAECQCPCGPPAIVFPKTGTTDETVSAYFDFTMKNLGGKKLDGFAPLVSISIDGKDLTTKASSDIVDGIKGKIIVSDGNGYVLPKGQHTIEMKLKLNDGTIVSGKATINFQKAGTCPPCPP